MKHQNPTRKLEDLTRYKKKEKADAHDLDQMKKGIDPQLKTKMFGL